MDFIIKVHSWFRESTDQWVGEIHYDNGDVTGVDRYTAKTEQEALDKAFYNLSKDLIPKYYMSTPPKPKTLTVGYMARVTDKARQWSEYAGRYCIITDVSGSGDFSVLLFPAGYETPPPLKLASNVIGAEAAWVDSDELIFVNDNVADNMAFYAKCKVEEDFCCPDCCEWNKEHKSTGDGDLKCPFCGCEW